MGLAETEFSVQRTYWRTLHFKGTLWLLNGEGTVGPERKLEFMSQTGGVTSSLN